MDKAGNDRISFDEFDERHWPRPEESEFDAIVERAISRRAVLAGIASASTAGFLTSAGFGGSAHAADRMLSFAQVAATGADTITLPPGFSWQVVAAWGDPMWSNAPEFDHGTRGTSTSQELSFGSNTDGMEAYVHDGRLILAINNEYTDLDVTCGNRASGGPETEDDFRKGMMAHGLTVVEVAERGGRWGMIKDSPYNRRVTPQTPMELSGPAAGHQLLRTEQDPTGTVSRGTWNNCGSGSTPWGTYLACEENFNGYFSSSDEGYEPSAPLKRYGVGVNDWGYGWRGIDERFDISRHPNEPNRAGYVVELDPTDPASVPKKRTALGRFKHENAEVVIADDGRVVVYMGDDERGEFLYRFVSSGKVSEGNPDILDEGTLYAARFRDDGTGEWLELSPASAGMASQAEVCIHTRLAASAVGATTMDRPEWVTAHPGRAEVYCALTNNKNRGVKPNAGGDATPAAGPNPREKNNYGQIVRWRPDGGDHTAPGFDWDLYVLAGNPAVHSDAYAGSDNVNAGNMFNSPDGIAFDSAGGLWIQTDGNYGNEGDFSGQGNNQMLLGDTDTGEIRRFLVGPRQAEITGLCWDPTRTTMFVGVQHPGEGGGDSHFPGGGDSVPRSAIIAVRRDDGGLIG